MAGYDFEEQSTDAGSKKETTGASVQVRPLDYEGRSESERAPQSKSRPWRPVSLQYPFLLGVLASTIGLIVVLQYLLARSQRDQGILFAKNISDLPISRTFGYTYGPTIVSVVFGLLWNWIDVDVKRLEPFFQLSKPDGALGKDSLLLEYPFDFALAIPFQSWKQKHWAVFMSSTAIVLIFLGLTPTQAGIFNVQTIYVKEDLDLLHAKAFVPIEDQEISSAIYAQSVYNIAWLNESLPPFMTRDYILEAFGPGESWQAGHEDMNITANTTMYSVDVVCEQPTFHEWYGGVNANSSNGCNYKPPIYRPIRNNDTSKPYDTMYVGYSNQNGFADYYLSSMCPPKANQTFFVRWTKSSIEAITAPQTEAIEDDQVNATSLFCMASYHRQHALATVSFPKRAPVSVLPWGPKLPLPGNMLNVSEFESLLNSNVGKGVSRGSYPEVGLPEQKTHLQDLPLNLAYLPRMAPFAIAAHQLPIERYLDPQDLADSYESAYRLLFARRLSDVLRHELDPTNLVHGTTTLEYTTQAIAVVPGFVYAATTILGTLTFLELVLVTYLWSRPFQLRSDPGSISALMHMCRGSAQTIVTFSRLDRSSSKELDAAISGTKFKLLHQEHLDIPRLVIACTLEQTSFALPSSNLPFAGYDDPKLKGVRPSEIKLTVGIIFFLLQALAAAVFAALYAISRTKRGLDLPSSVTTTRQVLQNYMPVAFATVTEPFWLVLNRLLCMLQPYEQMRHANAHASRSVDLSYGSLPPQLVFSKAIRARHYLLVLVCFVAILMNALAVALSGLMYEDSIATSATTSLFSSYSPVLRELNATGIPFNADAPGDSQGGTTQDQFYRDMSNLTAGTPLPPWTDGTSVWLPARVPDMNANETYRVNTPAFSATLRCQLLTKTSPIDYSLTFESDAMSRGGASIGRLNVSIPRTSASEARGPLDCHDHQQPSGSPKNSLRNMRVPGIGRSALELGVMLSNSNSTTDDAACRQYIVVGWIRADWQYAEPSDATPPTGGTSSDEKPQLRLASLDSTLLLCKPDLAFDPEASVLVDNTGLVRGLRSEDTAQTLRDSQKPGFNSSSDALFAQANQFLIDNGATWHQDAFPSDWTNYLLSQSNTTTSLLDHEAPPPIFQEIVPRFSQLYGKLFAILFSSNFDRLLEPADTNASVSGEIVSQQTKVFISLPAFIVTECVLIISMIATTLLYVRWRAWRLLPRLPTNVASTVAFFAASHALREMDVGRHMRFIGSAEGRKWGFGYFIGADAGRHVGIERAPLVSATKAHGEGTKATFF